MIYYSKQNVVAGATIKSVTHYIGSTNAPAPLVTNPALNLFINGASAKTTVTLQVAVIPTNVNQVPAPIDSDFINYEAPYVDNTIKSIPTLNGCWVRFVVANTDTTDSIITCMLE